MAREDLVLKHLKDYFKERRIFFIRMGTQNGIGLPDIVACIDGTFYGIELKDDKNGKYRMTQAQYLRLESIVASGGVACVIDKNNIEEFKFKIDRHIKINNNRFGYERR